MVRIAVGSLIKLMIPCFAYHAGNSNDAYRYRTPADASEDGFILWAEGSSDPTQSLPHSLKEVNKPFFESNLFSHSRYSFSVLLYEHRSDLQSIILFRNIFDEATKIS